ncbi:MAG: cell division protein FtsL [Candidatus Marinimicrobia bacterium]|nr:cell division protein FtsL [Candidatus Neomarinimicrobiota bacterium]
MLKKSEKRKKIILFVLLVAAILFPVLGITIKNYTTNLLDEIKNKRAQELALINQNKRLINKASRLQSASRLKEYAVENLNMYNPEPETLSIIINQQYLNNAK